MFGMVPFRRNNGLSHEVGDLSKWVDNFFNDVGFLSFLPEGGNFKVDIRETDKEYVIEADMPGVSKEQIQLKVENDYLTVVVNKNEEKNEEKGNYIRRERRTGSYSRSFQLNGVKNEGIDASFKDGVLSITLPKDEEKKSKGRSIEIH